MLPYATQATQPVAVRSIPDPRPDPEEPLHIMRTWNSMEPVWQHLQLHGIYLIFIMVTKYNYRYKYFYCYYSLLVGNSRQTKWNYSRYLSDALLPMLYCFVFKETFRSLCHLRFYVVCCPLSDSIYFETSCFASTHFYMNVTISESRCQFSPNFKRSSPPRGLSRLFSSVLECVHWHYLLLGVGNAPNLPLFPPIS